MNSSITVPSVSFNELLELNKSNHVGYLVVRGGGHPDNSQAWIDGINDDLMERGVTTSPITEAMTVHVCEGRDDLVLVYTTAEGLNMGKMAMWRLQSLEAGWNLTWLEDYVVNDKDYFTEGLE